MSRRTAPRRIEHIGPTLLLAAFALLACQGGDVSPMGAGDGGAIDTRPSGEAASCVPTGVEICDGIDNDCNGLVDDGVFDGVHCLDVTQIGDIDDGLVQIPAGDPDNPRDQPGLTLAKNTQHLRHLWAANHTHDSVTKFDMEQQNEVARYWTGINPSRTAVDLEGNCWVGGREDGRVTHIMQDTSKCPDRNGNGRVDTSSVVNGQVVQLSSAEDPLADECVLFSAVTHPDRPSIRGLAPAPDGKVWIGYTKGGIQSIDPRTHALGPFISDESLPLFRPDATGKLVDSGEKIDGGGVYGMVVDAAGLLYISSAGDRRLLPVYDTVAGKWIGVFQRPDACSYGIALDSKGRVFTGGYPLCAGVSMFDPAKRKFFTFGTPPRDQIAHGLNALATLVPGGGSTGTPVTNDTGATWMAESTTGVAVEPKTGDVWASFFGLGYTGRLRLDETDLSKSTWTFIGTVKQANGENLPEVGNDLRGIGFDAAGFAWTLGLGSDRVFKIDPATNARHASLPEGKSIGVGSHYTYSDFTGSTALTFTAPQGVWRHVVQYDTECTVAQSVEWEAFVPPGASVGVRLRATEAGLGDWVPGASTYFEYPAGEARDRIDLGAYAAKLGGTRFEIEVRLLPDPVSHKRPVLYSLKVPPTHCVD